MNERSGEERVIAWKKLFFFLSSPPNVLILAVFIHGLSLLVSEVIRLLFSSCALTCMLYSVLFLFLSLSYAAHVLCSPVTASVLPFFLMQQLYLALEKCYECTSESQNHVLSTFFVTTEVSQRRR